MVDLHAITNLADKCAAQNRAAALHEDTLATVAIFLAAGVDPAQSTIFVQSHVRQHAELQWLLSCASPSSYCCSLRPPPPLLLVSSPPPPPLLSAPCGVS